MAPIALILLVAAALRLYNVGFGLPALYDPDEPMFVMGSVRMLRDQTLNPGWFGHPGTTTIYALAIIELAVFGLGWLTGRYADAADFSRATYADPAILFLPDRFFFVACGVLCVYLTWRLGRQLFGRAAGLVAALLLAINPLHIQWSQVIRTDIQATVFALACMLFAVRAAREGRLRDYLAAGAMAGLACATKWPVALVLVCIAGAAASRVLADPGSMAREGRRLALAVLASVATLVVVSPYLILDHATVIDNLAGEAQLQHVGSNGTGFLGNAAWYAGAVLRECMGAPGVALAAAGAVVIALRHRVAALVLIPFALLFAAVVCAQNLVWARWMLPLLPLLALFAAVAITGAAGAIAARTGARAARIAPAAIVLLAVAPVLPVVHAEARERRNDTRMLASAWARAHIPDGSRIALEHLAFDLLDRPWTFLVPAGRPGCVDAVKHLTGQIRYAEIETWRKDKAVVDIGTVDPARLESCRGDYAILTHLDRYEAERARFGPELASYGRLVAGGRLLATFRPSPGELGGPVVRIYRLADAPRPVRRETGGSP